MAGISVPRELIDYLGMKRQTARRVWHPPMRCQSTCKLDQLEFNIDQVCALLTAAELVELFLVSMMPQWRGMLSSKAVVALGRCFPLTLVSFAR